jgi:DNA replication protein DnaC
VSESINDISARLLAALPAPSGEQEEQRASERAEQDRLQAVRDRSDTIARWVNDGVPAKDVELALDRTARTTEAMIAVGDFARSDKTILVLSGPRGLGKTTAAACWLVLAPRRKTYGEIRQPVFVDAPRLVRSSRYDTESMAGLELARALVVDDLGLEYDDKSGAARSLIDALMNARYARCLPTVITTNVPSKDVGEKLGFISRYGERLADRIREAGTFVALRGESLRRTPLVGEPADFTWAKGR